MKKAALILVLVAIGVGLYLFSTQKKDKGPAIKYVSVPVKKGKLVAEISCTGTLKPLVEVVVGSQVSGTIKELHADFESRVNKGDLIALIDPASFEAQKTQAEADVNAARASLAKSEVNLVFENRNLERQEQLRKRNSISESDFDSAKSKADAARAQVTLDKARVLQAEAKLREAQLQLTYTRILAPVSGVVTSRSVDVGQTVAASFQAPVLFRIAEDLKSMQVNANVDEADIGLVKVGQRALFGVPAFPERVFRAKVVQIRNDPTIEQNVVTYNVVLDLDNSELLLRPGMTAHVKILLSEVEDALMLPEQAVRFSPPAQAFPGKRIPDLPELKPGQKRIWKIESSQRLAPVVVRLGVVGTENVQILSDALKSGDQVAVDAIVKKKKRSRRGLRFAF